VVAGEHNYICEKYSVGRHYEKVCQEQSGEQIDLEAHGFSQQAKRRAYRSNKKWLLSNCIPSWFKVGAACIHKYCRLSHWTAENV
jgi:hypothetical protein